MIFLRALLLLLLLVNPVVAAETYDLIFREGSLSGLPQTEVLTYDRRVGVEQNPEYSARNTGSVRLTFEPDDMARLQFVQQDKQKVLGRFPATVGNPIIMYFVETVLRDVAHEAGGSPFYIRNRIKDSLLLKVPVIETDVPFGDQHITAKQIVLRPFETDKNRDKMGAYADLSLTFTMSEQVPGWYSSLVAIAPGKEGAPGYSNSLTLLTAAEAKE